MSDRMRTLGPFPGDAEPVRLIDILGETVPEPPDAVSETIR
jgi:hypothetical protein